MLSSSYYYPHEQRIYYIPQDHHQNISAPLQIPIPTYHHPKQLPIITHPVYCYNPLPNQYQYAHTHINKPIHHRPHHTHQQHPMNHQNQSPTHEQTTHDLKNRLHHRRYQHALLREGLRRRLHIHDLLFLLGHKYKHPGTFRIMGGGGIGMFLASVEREACLNLCVRVLTGFVMRECMCILLMSMILVWDRE